MYHRDTIKKEDLEPASEDEEWKASDEELPGKARVVHKRQKRRRGHDATPGRHRTRGADDVKATASDEEKRASWSHQRRRGVPRGDKSPDFVDQAASQVGADKVKVRRRKRRISQNETTTIAPTTTIDVYDLAEENLFHFVMVTARIYNDTDQTVKVSWMPIEDEEPMEPLRELGDLVPGDWLQKSYFLDLFAPEREEVLCIEYTAPSDTSDESDYSGGFQSPTSKLETKCLRIDKDTAYECARTSPSCPEWPISVATVIRDGCDLENVLQEEEAYVPTVPGKLLLSETYKPRANEPFIPGSRSFSALRPQEKSGGCYFSLSLFAMASLAFVVVNRRKARNYQLLVPEPFLRSS